ncbi:MAG: hypothetical protein RBU37_13730 [Myxococcota bacterium]|nr:hypothetical protein [Myxococcota bacterium]
MFNPNECALNLTETARKDGEKQQFCQQGLGGTGQAPNRQEVGGTGQAPNQQELRAQPAHVAWRPLRALAR